MQCIHVEDTSFRAVLSTVLDAGWLVRVTLQPLHLQRNDPDTRSTEVKRGSEKNWTVSFMGVDARICVFTVLQNSYWIWVRERPVVVAFRCQCWEMQWEHATQRGVLSIYSRIWECHGRLLLFAWPGISGRILLSTGILAPVSTLQFPLVL